MINPSAKPDQTAAAEYCDFSTKPNRTALILDRRTGEPLMRCTASRPGPSADAARALAESARPEAAQ